MRNSPTQRRGGWLSLMGRLALIVSLWNAPIPVLHAHGADVTSADASETFVDHLATYHHDDVNSHVDFGWHWHLVPKPAKHPTGTKGHDCPFCPHDTADFELQVSQGPVSCQQITAPIPMVWPATVPQVTMPMASAPSQFLDTYLDSVPLRTLLRVARC